MRWVSVKDRLPDIDTKVLVSAYTIVNWKTLEKGYVTSIAWIKEDHGEGWYEQGDGCGCCNSNDIDKEEDITHWAYLPKGPQEVVDTIKPKD